MRRLSLTITIILLATAPFVTLAQAAVVATAQITAGQGTVTTADVVPVTIRVVNASTGTPLSGVGIVFQAKLKSSGTVVSTSAPRTTPADGTGTTTLGPIGTAGTYDIVAVLTGAGISPNPTNITGPTLAVTGPNAAAGSAASPTPAATLGDVVTLPNPITCGDATCLISQVVRYILGAIAVLATLMFIWGGVMMLTSGGNADQVKRARETLSWAAIGIVVIMLSWAIIKTVLQAIVNNK